MKALTAPIFIFLFLFPIAALAADANAPTAPAVQSAAWTTADYLRAALSGAFGGLVSGIIALFISWETNENALRINREKIKADQIAQDKNYKNQITKLRYEEMRKACCELLSVIDPSGIIDRSVNIKEVLKRRNVLTIMCEYEYSVYVKKISDMLILNRENLFLKSRPNYIFTVEHQEMIACMANYTKFFNVFSLVTKDMLDGHIILPAGEWNIMDFENSIPLDYKQRLS